MEVDAKESGPADQMEVEESKAEGSEGPHETEELRLANGTGFAVKKGSGNEKAARYTMEVDEQDGMLRELASQLDNCHMEGIYEAFDKFAQKLVQLSASKEHGPFQTIGYVGIKALPMALGALMGCLQRMLPDECHPQEWQTSELIANIIRRLDTSYDGSPLAVLPYSEMLKPDSSMIKNAFLLQQREVDWVRSSACASLADAHEKLEQGYPMTPDVKERLAHWQMLSHGSLPWGFNSEYEHRYSTLDLDHLLRVDLPDPTEHLKALSPYSTAYLTRVAREQLDIIKSGHVQASEDQKNHLGMIANRQYPHGFHESEDGSEF